MWERLPALQKATTKVITGGSSSVDLWPLWVRDLFVFPAGTSSFCPYLWPSGRRAGRLGKRWRRPKAQSLLRAWNLICLHLLHPYRLLTFTPDPVTPSSGLQQQQKQEIREIDRLEGITVALFILGCARSWHSLLAALQLNLSTVYFFGLPTGVWTETKL